MGLLVRFSHGLERWVWVRGNVGYRAKFDNNVELEKFSERIGKSVDTVMQEGKICKELC
jgi:hypothetical protein